MNRLTKLLMVSAGLLLPLLAAGATAALASHGAQGRESTPFDRPTVPFIGAHHDGPSGPGSNRPQVLSCGALITQSTRLANDVGPCDGNGLTIAADNVKLNLAGHKVYSASGAGKDVVGILFDNVSGSSVANGEVTGFDAGVAVNGGGHNTVTHLYVHDNINVAPTDDPNDQCNYGDGITTTTSNDNLIAHDLVVHNGPYSGISLVDTSSGNVVTHNRMLDNNVPNTVDQTYTGDTGGCGNCGGFAGCRSIQDIGIRIEGPADTDNRVTHNYVDNSAIGGITIHGFVYNPPGGLPPQAQNSGNLIAHNYVANTGAQTFQYDPLADGIAFLRQGPARIVGVSQGNTVAHNVVVDSRRHGIYLGNATQPGPVEGNRVLHNQVYASGADGVYVAEGSVNNTLARNHASGSGTQAAYYTANGDDVGHDGYDGNAACDNNAWIRNEFGTVNQACVDPDATVTP